MVINDNSIYCVINSPINRCRILSTQYRWYGDAKCEWNDLLQVLISYSKRLLWMLRFETAGRGRNTREGFHYYLQKPLFRDLENYRDFQGRELKVSVIFFSLSASQMRVKSEVVHTMFIFLIQSSLYVLCLFFFSHVCCFLFSYLHLSLSLVFFFCLFSLLDFFLLLQSPFHQLPIQHLHHHHRIFIIIFYSLRRHSWTTGPGSACDRARMENCCQTPGLTWASSTPWAKC